MHFTTLAISAIVLTASGVSAQKGLAPWLDYLNPAAPAACRASFTGAEAKVVGENCGPAFAAVGANGTTPQYFNALFSKQFSEDYCKTTCGDAIEVFAAKLNTECGKATLLNPQYFGGNGQVPSLMPYQRLDTAGLKQLATFSRRIHCLKDEQDGELCLAKMWIAAGKIGKASMRRLGDPEVICSVPACSRKMVKAAADHLGDIPADFAEVVIEPQVKQGQQSLETCPLTPRCRRG
ncbi:hypothetical protein HDU85_007047 [Gaertneriomyces sp. JEL0708]|nr:hypothetical protein HDU85_007047 [Gaertneriomyces sp. JEL0708]